MVVLASADYAASTVDEKSKANSDSKDPLALADGKVSDAADAGADHPPAYSPSAVVPPRSGAAPAAALPADLRPANFVLVYQHNKSAKGTHAIDPSLAIPAQLLPALPSGTKERRNLHMESHNGSVDGEVWLAPAPNAAPRERATLYFHSHNGSVTAKLHSLTPNVPPHPFVLHASSNNGSVAVSVPRTFRGSITLRSQNGSKSLSAELGAHFTVYSEEKNVRRGFVGNIGQADGGAEHVGDELVLESKNGSVKVRYEDEDAVAIGLGKLSKFFGGKKP